VTNSILKLQKFRKVLKQDSSGRILRNIINKDFCLEQLTPSKMKMGFQRMEPEILESSSTTLMVSSKLEKSMDSSLLELETLGAIPESGLESLPTKMKLGMTTKDLKRSSIMYSKMMVTGG
jgi:hypothetical protein